MILSSGSLKSDARDKRGTGARRRVVPDNTIPRKWSEFVKNSMNKTELFQFLSDTTVSLEVQQLIVLIRHKGTDQQGRCCC